MLELKRVLLTGATGFVGRHVYPALIQSGMQVVCGTRNPERAQRRFPGRPFTRLDVLDYDVTLRALHGCDAAVYLVHGMGDHKRYERAEERSAKNFVRAAEQVGLKRIVYLGGIRPRGKPSRHLRSRIRTGEILRSGRVSTIELQATMVIGSGSESWRIVRDLAARLPVMLLPRWLDNRSQPIHIDDAVEAIRLALTLENGGVSTAYTLPGPEILSARDILARTAELMGLHPHMLRMPVMTPRLSSYWISLVTRADPFISRQLVEGLRHDLVAPDRGFWRLFPEHQRMSFDEAARRELRAEADALSLRGRITEWLIHKLVHAVEKVDKDAAARGTVP